MPPIIPEWLASTCSTTPERQGWFEQLPNALRDLQQRWSLILEAPFDYNEGSCAWVAPAVCQDGTHAILKLGMPHMEGQHEIEGLRFWNGNPTAYLLEADEDYNAMLLERCEPGTALRQLPEPEQDVIISGLLKRIWQTPSQPHPFRPLAAMTAFWASETIADSARWPDVGLVQAGLHLFEELPRTAPRYVLLATDLHAGNVLQAQREPWLVIDPKPFVGDPAYDATQHLFNCRERLYNDPHTTIRRFADLLELDAERVRLWMFARAAAESRDTWDDQTMALARALT
ncbi:MAG: aminoglycoside phosphotransferase family protein [Roseiflexaceae bacterium]|nr:aminoglycoside phosphotransferase family protein [Roseiflexaceae bacterium]